MAAFETIEARLELTADSFTSGIDDAVSSLGTLEDRSVSAKKAVGALGVGMAAVAAGGIAKSISAASDLDSALTESQAIMGELTENQMDAMESKAREIGKTTTFSASEAGEAFYFLASAGMDAEQSVSAMGTVAEFATAGAFDLATATDLATDAQSALGLASENAAENEKNLARVTDTLVKANTLANASVEQFSTALTNKAAAAMREAGIEIEEGTSALAVFADQGLKGNRAGTILARTIQGLQAASRDNAAAFEELGLRVYDAQGNMRPLADIVEDMDTAMGNMSTEQRNAAMEQLGLNERAAQGVSLMMGNADAMREYEGELKNAGGTAGDVAANQLQSFSAQVEILKSNVLDVAIGIGNVFLPVLTDLVSGLTGVVFWFGNFNDRLDGLPGAIGLVSTLVGGLTAAAWGLQGTMATALIPSLGTLATAIGAVAAPITIVAGLMAAWITDFAGVRTSALLVARTLRDELIATITTLRSVVNTVLGPLSRRWESHTSRVESTVGNLIGRLTTVFLEGIPRIGERIRRTLRGIEATWQTHGSTVVSVVGWYISQVKEAFAALTNFIGHAFAGSFGDARASWRSFVATLKQTAAFGLHDIRTIFGDDLASIRARLELFTRRAGVAWTGFYARLPQPARDALGGIRDTATRLLGEIEGLWDEHGGAIESAVRDAMAFVKEHPKEILTTLATAVLPGPIGLIVGTFERNWADIKQTVRESMATVRGLTVSSVRTINTEITTPLQTTDSQFSQTFGSILTEVRQSMQVIYAVIDGVLSTILNTVVGPGLQRLERLHATHFGETLRQTRLTMTALWQDVIKPVLDIIQAGWAMFGDELLTVLRFTLDALMGLLEGFLDAFLTAWNVTMALFRGDWGDAWRLISDFFARTLTGILDFARGWGARFLGWLGGLLQQALQAFINWAQSLIFGSLIPNTFNAILQFASGWGKRFLGLLQQIVQRWLGMAQQWLGLFRQRVHAGFMAVLSTAQQFGSLLVNTFTRIVNTVLSTVHQFLSTLSTAIGQTFANIGRYVASWGGSFVRSLFSTVSNAWDVFRQALRLIATGVHQTFENILAYIARWGGQFVSRVQAFLSASVRAARSWVSAFTQPFRDAKERVIREFNQLRRAVTGNSIVPEMLNQSLAQTAGWKPQFTGHYADAAGSVRGSFRAMQRGARAPTPGGGIIRALQTTTANMGNVADRLERTGHAGIRMMAYGDIKRQLQRARRQGDVGALSHGVRAALEAHAGDIFTTGGIGAESPLSGDIFLSDLQGRGGLQIAGLGGRDADMNDLYGELSNQTNVMAEGFQIMADFGGFGAQGGGRGMTEQQATRFFTSLERKYGEFSAEAARDAVQQASAQGLQFMARRLANAPSEWWESEELRAAGAGEIMRVLQRAASGDEGAFYTARSGRGSDLGTAIYNAMGRRLSGGDSAIREALKMQRGGIATGPTNALIGEKGPEAVIPLSRLDEFAGSQQPSTVVVEIDTDDAALQRILDQAETHVRTSQRRERKRRSTNPTQ